jgi:hypothetical protein
MKPVRARKARKSSRLACGHWVKTGERIIHTGQRWECVTCVLARVMTQPPRPGRGGRDDIDA